MKCLLDMDGVLVDFMTGAHKAHNLPYDYTNYPYKLGEWDCIPPSTSTLTTGDFWNKLDEEFWATLDWMPDGKKILEHLEKFFGRENICLCTSPALNVSCCAGKIRWIQKEMPEYARRYMVTPAKHFAASPSNVLVDDAEHNIKAFRAAGGRTITVPRKWNGFYGLDGETIPTILRQLSSL